MNNPTPKPEPGLPELPKGHRFLTPEEKLRPLPEGAMVWTVDEWEPTLSPGRVVDNCPIYCIPTAPEDAQEGELLPCPFCGKLPRVRHLSFGDYIICLTNCCPASYHETLTEEWNRRATPADAESALAPNVNEITHPWFEQIRELRCAHADAIARAETAERDLTKTKERACGCVKCVCEDEEQCQGCGATECSYHNQLRRGLERELKKAIDENAGLRAEIARLTLNKEGAIDLAIHGGHQLKATIADRDRLAERVRELEKGLLHQRGGLMIVRDRQGGMASVEDINVGIKHIDDLLTPPATKSGNVSDCPNCNDTGWVCGVGGSVPCPQCTPPASPLLPELARRLKEREWQPIATAPKTSQSILVHCAERRNTFTVTWDKDGHRGGEWRVFGGYPLHETPTHWCPLPEPPQSALNALDALEGGK